MKELDSEFIGTGQVRGFKFKRELFNDRAFIYSVTTETETHYEVFLRKENTQFNCVSYPSDKAFGIWAWTYKTWEQAYNKFISL